jgi:hypothetical protein
MALSMDSAFDNGAPQAISAIRVVQYISVLNVNSKMLCIKGLHVRTQGMKSDSKGIINEGPPCTLSDNSIRSKKRRKNKTQL